jgi:glutamate:GABA antiporter
MPHAAILHLDGFMTAIEQASGRIGFTQITPVIAALIVLGGLGQAGAWFAAGGRLPFVAGIDRFLPLSFGRVHPRYGSPHVSLLVQAAVAAVFILLGQAGTTVRGAYDVLVSMSIISYFIPYLFIFSALIRLQRVPAGPAVIRVPGGRGVAVGVGVIGVLTTSLSILLALIPPEDEPKQALAVTKVAGSTALLIAGGAAVYFIGKRRRSD